MNNKLLICSNVSDNWEIINQKKIFSSFDPVVFALLLIDGLRGKSQFTFRWIHQGEEFYTNSVIITPHLDSHRVMSYMKTAVIIENKLFGLWNVTVSLNSNIINDASFKVIDCNQNEIVVSHFDIHA